ncbi:MAG: histidine--tRNA ligase [Oscillospiraceae bacterium]|nr:histidine--tRNA ligase [Oscillospiraceae bacterium]
MSAGVKKDFPATKVMSGFMELLPEEQIEFDLMKDKILETFHSFGYTALDTPVMERLEILRAKDVGETATQIYEIEPRGEQTESKSGLRFDLTVPLARYVAEHFADLSFPFRRCHIAKVYRGERAQKGRFREFYQCDVDVIGHGSLSIRYDAEIPSIIYQLFKKLDFGKFTIRVNNRKLLQGLVDSLGCEASTESILGVIDRIEKISSEQFGEQLKELGLTGEMTDKLIKFFEIKGTNAEVLDGLKSFNVDNQDYIDGLSELVTAAEFMKALGVEEDYYKIDPVIVRGLSYYTGTVYETVLDDYPKLGSVCSGGRYDNLAEHYTKEKLPGVGISIGLTRLFHQIREIGLVECSKKTAADVIIVPKEDANIPCALSVSQLLRAGGFKVDVLLEDMNIKKKFKYVDRKDSRFTIVIGREEEDSSSVTLSYKGEGGKFEKLQVAQSELADKMKGLC